MGIINLFIFQMISFATKAAAGLLVTADDVPKELKWATKCPYKDVDWDKFKHFNTLIDHIKSRDQCMGISSYMFTIEDVNHNMKLSKCEMMYGCLASLYEEGQSKKKDFSNGKKCAIAINKFSKVIKDDITLKTMGEICAHEFPTLEGSPLEHDF